MGFVVTAGQVQAVDQASDYLPPGGGITLAPALSMTYEALWRAQPAVRTVIGFLARNVAQLGVDPYERVSATDRRKLGDHPLARLLERPMPGSDWTKYRLLSQTMHDLCLFDSAYWLKLRGDHQVQAIVPVPVRLIRPIGTSWLAPDAYRIQGSRGRRDVPPDQVVHFHGYNPEDPRTGASPIETLRQVLAEEYAATAYREQLWRNGARVAGYLARPADAPKWSPEARERFRRDWSAQYAGDGPAAGGTPVLEDGMTFASVAVTPRDAQYVESRKLTREECAIAYHVQPVLMGIMEGANFSSVSEIHRWLYQDTLAPYLIQLAQDIEAQLLWDLDPAGAETGSVYVEFNLQEKLRGSFEQQAAAISSSVGGPWMTRDEARALHNLPSIPGADELIVPLNVITGGLASPRATAPRNPSNEASNGQPAAHRHPAAKARRGTPAASTIARVLAAFFERQGRVVVYRAGAKAADLGGIFDAERWNDELAGDLYPAALAVAARAGRGLLAALALDPDAYDTERTAGWMTAYAAGLAQAINAATRQRIAEALAAADPAAAIRDVVRRNRDSVPAAAENEAAHLAGQRARPGHSALNGRTIGHRDEFPNGARWPRDSALGADDRAGCNCDLDWGIA